ncbi:MAG: hypothetical protein HRT58_21090 [Crocinitomicaceae bacterium]|nr:hypothetical protein [Flavobacteriales bacterium]NQZ38168.1 hypothetical protein [Crocinitomicaceae bacterium]
MNRYLFILMFIFSSLTSYGQVEYKNELGLDATGFVRYFTKFQSGTDFLYEPIYYLSYRRLFKSGNIRFALGGTYEQLEKAGFTDTTTYSKNTKGFSTRIGWEWDTEIGEKWSAYYGIDFRYTYNFLDDDFIFSNAGYINGMERKSNVIGLAPVLGVRFNINDRISLRTEASFSFNRGVSNNKQTYIALSGFPEKADDTAPKTTSIFTSFAQPISLFFTFTL